METTMTPHQPNLPMNLGDDRLTRIKALGDTLARNKMTIQNYEDNISQLKEANREIAEHHLPPLMDELQIASIQCADGSTIEVSDFVDARLKDPLEAFRWLREKNEDAIIKSNVVLKFGKGESEDKAAAIQALQSNGFEPEVKDDIHHMTLKSFVREALEKYPDLPKEAFGIYQARRVTFK